MSLFITYIIFPIYQIYDSIRSELIGSRDSINKLNENCSILKGARVFYIKAEEIRLSGSDWDE